MKGRPREYFPVGTPVRVSLVYLPHRSQWSNNMREVTHQPEKLTIPLEGVVVGTVTVWDRQVRRFHPRRGQRRDRHTWRYGTRRHTSGRETQAVSVAVWTSRGCRLYSVPPEAMREIETKKVIDTKEGQRKPRKPQAKPVQYGLF